MPTVDVRSATGATLGAVRLDDAVFGVKPNVPVLHQVVTAQLAAARSGNQSTKTRAEVRGGGRKPWRQKGSGRARQGSTRAPHWRGGGVALGPKPRSYRQRTPKKMIQLALHSALSDRASAGKVVVIDSWGLGAPKTRDAKAALKALGLEGQGKVLIVVDRDAENVHKSFRNLPDAQLLLASELNAYDILCCDWIVFTRSNVPGVTSDTTSATTSTTATATTSTTTSATATTSTTTSAATPSAEPTVGASPEPEPEPAGHDWDAPMQPGFGGEPE